MRGSLVARPAQTLKVAGILAIVARPCIRRPWAGGTLRRAYVGARAVSGVSVTGAVLGRALVCSMTRWGRSGRPLRRRRARCGVSEGRKGEELARGTRDRGTREGPRKTPSAAELPCALV